MPAAKLRPVRPSTTTRPPVMYSQPWSPTPSTTAQRAGVAHGEALAGEPAEERPPGGGAVQHGVADDHVLLGAEPRAAPAGAPTPRRPTGPCRCSRWSRRAAQNVTPGRQPGGEALPGRARERDLDRPLGQALGAVPARDLARQDAADGAVDVAHRHRAELDRLAALDRRRALRTSSQSSASSSTGTCGRVRRRGVSGGKLGRLEDHRQVDAARLPVVDRRRRCRAGRCGRSSPRSAASPSDAMISRTSSATSIR